MVRLTHGIVTFLPAQSMHRCSILMIVLLVRGLHEKLPSYLRALVCLGLVIGVAFMSNVASAHNGNVNSHGCHTPGGAGSGNPCHCHPSGKRSPDLPCENGQPASTSDEDESEETTDDETPELYRGLVVKDEDTCSTYVRDEYTYGPKLDVIKSKQLDGIYGAYENRCFDTYQDVDIEHLVAIKEAHDSGLCAADSETKIKFANDLENIVLASRTVNSIKSSHDAAGWLPNNQKCWYAAQVIRVKSKYKLSIDSEEKEALEEVLDECSFNETELQVLPECTLPESD